MESCNRKTCLSIGIVLFANSECFATAIEFAKGRCGIWKTPGESSNEFSRTTPQRKYRTLGHGLSMLVAATKWVREISRDLEKYMKQIERPLPITRWLHNAFRSTLVVSEPPETCIKIAQETLFINTFSQFSRFLKEATYYMLTPWPFGTSDKIVTILVPAQKKHPRTAIG